MLIAPELLALVAGEGHPKRSGCSAVGEAETGLPGRDGRVARSCGRCLRSRFAPLAELNGAYNPVGKSRAGLAALAHPRGLEFRGHAQMDLQFAHCCALSISDSSDESPAKNESNSVSLIGRFLRRICPRAPSVLAASDDSHACAVLLLVGVPPSVAARATSFLCSRKAAAIIFRRRFHTCIAIAPALGLWLSPPERGCSASSARAETFPAARGEGRLLGRPFLFLGQASGWPCS